ncbi:MAG: polyprenyl synthetase family protein [Deltaproteobacteria bacterium]|nr:polyprenyl synthetase family protein [Deltaproteobacteria bacterium]MCL5892851.1 polyprenyl synthetase family protein [Deltaproteobacteria bacterium]
MTDIEKYIEENKNLINDFLKTHFSKKAYNKKFPHNKFSLNDAMLYTLATPGKRIRPIILLITAESLGFSDKKRLIPFASSLELIHSYSLIHDDLPSMDNDSLRRGKPTNHIVFGEASAILAGDALLTEAFVILSDNEYTEGFDPKKIIEIIRELSYASGAGGLAGGQFLDVNSFGASLGFENIEYINKNKTASLIGAACAMGAILAGGDNLIVDNFKKFGSCLGLAFQTIDDVLGITGNKEILGKTTGIDKTNKKFTVVENIGLEKTYELINEYNEKALFYLNKTGAKSDALIEFTYHLTNRIN